MALRIGLSSGMIHPDPTRALFKGKRLLFAEESLFHWVLSQGALAFLIPTAGVAGPSLDELVASLDGILMTGGTDVSPQMYGETPLRPEWGGDPHRDAYDCELVRAAIRAKKPILGVCRGLQVINVALGGSLYQDITDQTSTKIVHRNWDIYDSNHHTLRIAPGSGLAKLYPGREKATINSVHHQGIKKLAPGLRAEGYCDEDGIVEAIRREAPDPYVFAIQWHPEWHDERYPDFLTGQPIMAEFLAAVCASKA